MGEDVTRPKLILACVCYEQIKYVFLHLYVGKKLHDCGSQTQRPVTASPHAKDYGISGDVGAFFLEIHEKILACSGASCRVATSRDVVAETWPFLATF